MKIENSVEEIIVLRLGKVSCVYKFRNQDCIIAEFKLGNAFVGGAA